MTSEARQCSGCKHWTTWVVGYSDGMGLCAARSVIHAGDDLTIETGKVNKVVSKFADTVVVTTIANDTCEKFEFASSKADK